MTDWATAEADYLAGLADRPGARAPATLSEVWSSEFNRAGLDTVSGVNKPLGDAFADIEGAIERHSGKAIGDYAEERGIRLSQAVTPDIRIRMLGQLVDTLPDPKAREAIAPLKDVRLNAAKKAQAIERDAAEVAGATYGLSGIATAFLAGVARQTLDPVNLTAMAVTAPMGGQGGLLTRIGTEALVNAGTQAIVEPYIQPARAELGLEAGFGKAAQNVIEAGIGGAVFSGVLHGAARALGYVWPGSRVEARAPETPPVESTSPAAGPSSIGPDDMAAAARLAERDEVVAPRPDVTSADQVVAHTAAVDNAARAMEEGRPVAVDQSALRPPVPERFDEVDYMLRSVEPDFGASLKGEPVVSRTDRLHESGGNQVGVKTVSIDGEVVGKAEVWVRDNEVTIQKIEVAPNFRRQGIATQIVDDLFAEFPGLEIRTSARTDEGRALFANYANDGLTIRQQLPASLSAAAPPRTPRGRAAADPQTWSLFEYLANEGGLAKDAGGDLDAIFGGTRGPFIPGFGPLLRKRGMSLDDAVTAAKEGGYFFDPNDSMDQGVRTFTIRDLLDAIDNEARGQKNYRIGFQAETGPLTENVLARTQRELTRALKKAGYGFDTPDEALTARTAELLHTAEETDVLAAYERAIMERGQLLDELADERQADANLADIPGWDAPDSRAASPDGGTGAQGGSASAGREAPGGGDAGEGARADGGDDRRAGSTSLDAERTAALKVDLDRTLTETGDVDVVLQNPDGSTRTVKASDALREIEEDAKAQAELDACIKGAGDEPPF